MGETRTTPDELTDAQRDQAYRAWAEGHNAEWIAARYGCFPAAMREWLEAEKRRREGVGLLAPKRLNAALFGVIEALEKASKSGDIELMRAEAERAKATESVARVIVANMALGLEVAKVTGQQGGDASVPKAFLTA